MISESILAISFVYCQRKNYNVRLLSNCINEEYERRLAASRDKIAVSEKNKEIRRTAHFTFLNVKVKSKKASAPPIIVK